MPRKSRAESDAAMAAAADAPAEPVNAVPSRRQMRAVFDGQRAGDAAPREARLNPRVVIPSPLNPRRGMDSAGLAELAASIVANGLLQPILVRPTAAPAGVSVPGESQWYETICGARRLAAIDLALKDGRLPPDYRIPARVRECSDRELVLLAATENLARADMHPLDEAAVFAAMRPHVTRQGDETTEAAIGKALGVSERSVFRRLALTRLAPELAEALRAKQINLGQAEAFALGDHALQLKHWRAIRGDDRDWQARPERIREVMTAAHIPADRALFDPALYQGEYVENPATGERWFADAAEFARLQETALRAKADELGKTWKWVEIDRSGFYWNKFAVDGVKKTDPEAGALIVVDRQLRVQTFAPALRRAVAEKREREKAARERARHGETGPARTPLTEAQVRTVHAVKTQAMRRAVAAHPSAALALSCLGLLGERDVRGMQGGDWHGRYDTIASAPAETDAIARLIATAALDLDDADRPKPGTLPTFDRCDTAAADPVKWFTALRRLPADALAELHRRLVAERIGSWAGYSAHSGAPWLGDGALAVAVAEATGAAAHLPALWQPDADFFKAYDIERLKSLLRTACPEHDLRGAKKSELVALCAAAPPGTWHPGHFPELRFQSEAQAKKALAGPPPAPGGARMSAPTAAAE